LQLIGQLNDGFFVSRHLFLHRCKMKGELGYFLLLTLYNGMSRIQLIQEMLVSPAQRTNG
jgi:hypothetical protein